MIRILLLAAILAPSSFHVFSQEQDVILDADTGNEMDDLYAIVQMAKEKSVNLIGLTSAHFNNVQLLTDSIWHIYPTENINTVQISQDLNEQLLSQLNLTDIPAPPGCDRMVGYAWGFYPGAPIPNAPAVEFIIEKARQYTPENKLDIICLGAVTNLAAAVLRAPEIVNNIRAHLLTMKYDDKGNWNKNSFNARNDINGLDVVLNEEDLELVIIPGQVSRKLVFNREETIEKLEQSNLPAKEMLIRRWDEVSAGKTWIMWDLALVQAYIDPSAATFKTLPGPPENGSRPVKVITDIDSDQIKKAFWDTLQK